MMKSQPLVTVFGGARVAPESELYVQCAELGRQLAQIGFVVATGGNNGTMEAVLQGALQAGGHTIGYTCAVFDLEAVANPWIREERKTASLSSRIKLMAEESDAFVAVHGGLGTLAELALVWNMILVKEIKPKPLIVVGEPWKRVLSVLHGETQLGSSAVALLTLVDTPCQVAQVLDSRLHD